MILRNKQSYTTTKTKKTWFFNGLCVCVLLCCRSVFFVAWLCYSSSSSVFRVAISSH